MAASDNTIFITEPMKLQINTHDFLVRPLCFTEVKYKERFCFRRAICRTPRSFINQTRRAFCCTSPMFQSCAEASACDRTPHMPKPDL